MKFSLSNFGDFALNLDEMKRIGGGYYASYCSYDCYYNGSGGQVSYTEKGWFGGIPSTWEHTRVPGTSAEKGLLCMITGCKFMEMG